MSPVTQHYDSLFDTERGDLYWRVTEFKPAQLLNPLIVNAEDLTFCCCEAFTSILMKN